MGVKVSMKACVLHAVGDLRVEEVPTPEPKAGEVLVKVKAAGVCGSDIPRILQKGTYHFPCIPGHEFSGQIVKVGEGVDEKLVGRKTVVFPLIPCRKCPSCEAGKYAQCDNYDYIGSRRDGAFAEYVVAPEWNLVLAPDHLSYEELAMCEPCGIAIHAINLADVALGDNVAIYGAGPIGIMIAKWAQIKGAHKIMLIDVDQAKVDFAKEIGFEYVINSLKEDPIAWVKEQTNGRMADVCMEVAGVNATIENCLLSTRKFGKIIGVGTPHTDVKISMAAYEKLLRNQIEYIGTWNSEYAELPKNEWKVVVDAIARGAMDVKPLVSHRVSLDDGIRPIQMMANHEEFFNKVLYIMD